MLFALVLVVLHFGTIEQFTRLAWAAHPEWFFLAWVAQAATYVFTSLVWREALRRAGHPRSLSTLVPLGIAKLFTDQVVPSGGVSGAILVARGLARRGVPTTQRGNSARSTPRTDHVFGPGGALAVIEHATGLRERDTAFFVIAAVNRPIADTRFHGDSG